MKDWLIKLLLFAFVTAVPLGTLSAQTNTPVTVVLQKASIRDVFAEIKKQVKVNFMYSNEDVNALPEKDYHLEQVTVAQVMEYALASTALTYEMVNSTVIIKRKTPKKDITGAIVDVSGLPLPGVSVVIVGTNKGTTTDMDGNFFLASDNAENIRLSISYLGMRRQELAWKGRKLHIVMEEDASEIDEVVITGYQVINKRALTSSVTTVKAEDILRPDVMSIDQMLEGQIPDMIFMSNSGETGVVPRIRIRGTSSIVGNREPLWVVDGIVVTDPVPISAEDLNDPDYVNRIGNAIAGLNPQDIERLDVLKDASATALYGTKAANGVIVVTTKRGRIGKPEVRYNNTFNFKRRPHYSDRSVDVMNSKERIGISRELFKDRYEYRENISLVGYEGLLDDLYHKRINDEQFLTKVGELETVNTDWFDLLTHNSFSQQHTISINGGSEQGSYYASIGYNDTDDVVKWNKNKRYTGMLNLNVNMAKWLSASFSMKGNTSKREYYQESLQPVEYAYTASRAIPAFDINGNYYYYKKTLTTKEGFNYNILNELNNSSVTQDGSSFSLDANFRFQLKEWLSANVIGSYSTSSTDISSYWGENTYYGACLRNSEYGSPAPSDSGLPQGGELTNNHTRSESYTLRVQFDLDKYFGTDEKHNFNGGIGYEMKSNHYTGDVYTMRGYYPDRGLSFANGIDLDYYTSYSGWLSKNVPTLTNDLTHEISGYATLTYNYDRMVYLNANARLDGSNRFGSNSNHKFLPVWSVSTSFNFSRLRFLRDLEWLDYLTTKASYGFQGNVAANVYPVLIIQKKPLNSYFNELETTASNYPNPNLKWERTNSFNWGMEMSLFDGKVQLEGSVYKRHTKDAFITKQISTINGTSSYIVNGGHISNVGYDVAITVHPIKTKDWRWSLSTSFSRIINSINTNPAGEQYELSDFLNGNTVIRGKSVGTFYSYKFLGLSPVDGGPMFDDWEDHYEDLIGLSKYDTFTRVLEASGSREPSIAGSLNTTLRYKTLRLNATLAYSVGAKTRLFGMYGSESQTNGGATVTGAGDIRPENNLSRDYLNRWKNPGDELHTTIPAIITRYNSDNYYKYQSHWSSSLNFSSENAYQLLADSYWDMYDYSNLRVVSASYLKCSNLSLTYEFPTAWLKNYGLSRLELTLSGSNLFTISDKKLKGQTPTQGGFTNIQLSDRPSYSFGFNVTF